MVSVCSPLLQYGQSFSVFTFSSRGFFVFAKLLFFVSDFHTVFNRGSSSTSISTTKINIYEDCLFKRRGFPCRVRWQASILLYFFLPFNYQLPIMAVPASDFHTVFRRGNSKIKISTTRINTYEDCLFKRRGFPCQVK